MLSFQYNTYYRLHKLDYREKLLSDDKWHTVYVERNIKQATLRVDNFKPVFINESVGQIPRLLDLTKRLVVGATADFQDGFVGCMRGLRVNGVLMDMKGVVKSGMFTYGVQAGLLMCFYAFLFQIVCSCILNS